MHAKALSRSQNSRKPLFGHLDSGANCTIMGSEEWEILKQIGLPLSKTTRVTCVDKSEPIRTIQ